MFDRYHNQIPLIILIYNIQWNERHPTKSLLAREKLSFVDGGNGPTIWYSASDKSLYDGSEGGMVEYSIHKDKILNIIEYPDHIKPCRQCVCYHKNTNQFFIIDGENGTITIFDATSRKFIVSASIQHIGTYPSAVIVFDTIHIFHGDKNTNQHITYNIEAAKVATYLSLKADDKRDYVGALRYKNRIIKFGGFNNDPDGPIDLVFISSEIKPDDEDPPKWIMKEEWKLPIPLAGCGNVLYKDYVIIFGGVTLDADFIDTVYLLDLQKDDGWEAIQHIKCPIASKYSAVLTSDNHVHLFTETNKWPAWKMSVSAHYSIPISTILGSKFGH